MQWFRVYHGISSDQKLHAASRKAKVRRSVATAAWIAILEQASQSEPRGDVSRLDARLLASMIDEPTSVAGRLTDAFVALGMIVDGCVSAWDRRQKDSDFSAKRVKKHRDAKSAKPLENNETDGGCNVTVTGIDKIREDKIESTIVDSPPIPPTPEPVSPSAQSAVADVFQPSLPVLLDLPASRPPTRTGLGPAFSEFWKAYPRKVGKGAAEKAWQKAIKIADMELIGQGLRTAIKAWKANETEVRFIPHASTWLNERRWEDQPSIHMTPRKTNGEISLTRLMGILNIGTGKGEEYVEDAEVESGSLPSLLGPDDDQDQIAQGYGGGHWYPH